MLKAKNTIAILLLVLALIMAAFSHSPSPADGEMLAYTVDAKKQDLQFYWQDDQGVPLESIQNLKDYVGQKGLTLDFAMNGGMFNQDLAPQGLFIQNYKTLHALDTSNGTGNFYLKPNGVFCISSDNIPRVCKTSDFKDSKNVKYATQSGPMLLIDGLMHPAFKAGSHNLNIRNGVGILPDGKVLFAMSKSKINFYDFARYFQSLGCKDALYLDGFVSQTYLPKENWLQTGGPFGVIIGVTRKKK